jgi:outer membrane protein OmpA-like peptidoglycan-associated protein
MMGSSRLVLRPDERGLGDAPARSRGKFALFLGMTAIALSLVLGLVFLTSMRRLEHEVARLSQQTEALSRVVERTQTQSETMAQQASQAAANAQAAAEQRDLAKRAESNSEVQAQLARQQADSQQERADQATKQAEAYRQDREAALEQLQQALGQIAETHRTAVGLVMTLDNKSIRFDFDKANIKPEYRDILNRIAGIIMTLKGYTIAVYGYTDDIGTQAYNLQLSQRRAEAVRDFLVHAGISANVMSTKGFGKSDPRVPGESEQARASNRRVEIAIVDSKLVTNGPLLVPN